MYGKLTFIVVALSVIVSSCDEGPSVLFETPPPELIAKGFDDIYVCKGQQISLDLNRHFVQTTRRPITYTLEFDDSSLRVESTGNDVYGITGLVPAKTSIIVVATDNLNNTIADTLDVEVLRIYPIPLSESEMSVTPLEVGTKWQYDEVRHWRGDFDSYELRSRVTRTLEVVGASFCEDKSKTFGVRETKSGINEIWIHLEGEEEKGWQPQDSIDYQHTRKILISDTLMTAWFAFEPFEWITDDSLDTVRVETNNYDFFTATVRLNFVPGTGLVARSFSHVTNHDQTTEHWTLVAGPN